MSMIWKRRKKKKKKMKEREKEKKKDDRLALIAVLRLTSGARPS
jgi:hypothetical protein